MDTKSGSPLNQALPSIDVKLKDGMEPVNVANYFQTRSGVIFGVPGAFTPTCSEKHLPGFVTNSKEIKRYVDYLGCVAVNDAFVLKAWSSSANSQGIDFIPDPLGNLVTALGLSQDLSAKGLGLRAKRFAMIIFNGKIDWVGLDSDAYAEMVIEKLKEKLLAGVDVQKMISEAADALGNSHAVYSKRGGSGVSVCSDIGITKGCTVENCAYPNSICGVKASLFNALSQGASKIKAMAIIGQSGFPYICGQCRETTTEFGSFPIFLLKSGSAEHEMISSKDLLPSLSSCSNTRPSSDFLSGRRFKTTVFSDNYSLKTTKTPAESEKSLMDAALLAARNAYIPASQFPVGAAVMTDKGMFIGTNIEHQIIGLGLCAERVAICNAVAGGARKIISLAVCCKSEEFARPCGGCRQSLVEFGDFPIYMINPNHSSNSYDYQIISTFEILPEPFCPASLGK